MKCVEEKAIRSREMELLTAKLYGILPIMKTKWTNNKVVSNFFFLKPNKIASKHKSEDNKERDTTKYTWLNW